MSGLGFDVPTRNPGSHVLRRLPGSQVLRRSPGFQVPTRSPDLVASYSNTSKNVRVGTHAQLENITSEKSPNLLQNHQQL